MTSDVKPEVDIWQFRAGALKIFNSYHIIVLIRKMSFAFAYVIQYINVRITGIIRCVQLCLAIRAANDHLRLLLHSYISQSQKSEQGVRWSLAAQSRRSNGIHISWSKHWTGSTLRVFFFRIFLLIVSCSFSSVRSFIVKSCHMCEDACQHGCALIICLLSYVYSNNVVRSEDKIGRI